MEKKYHSKLEWLRAKLDKVTDYFEPYYTDYFKTYHKRLQDWFVRQGYREDDANDLAKITLAQFIQCQKEGKYQEIGKKWGYLQRIAALKHAHLRRIKNSETELPENYCLEADDETDDETDLLEADQCLLQQENKLQDCLAQAKQANAETIYLFALYCQNKKRYTIGELAAQVQGGVSEGGLKRRFTRMRDKLKKCLENKQKSPHGSTF